jgi:hypothetical protein
MVAHECANRPRGKGFTRLEPAHHCSPFSARLNPSPCESPCSGPCAVVRRASATNRPATGGFRLSVGSSRRCSGTVSFLSRTLIFFALRVATTSKGRLVLSARELSEGTDHVVKWEQAFPFSHPSAPVRRGGNTTFGAPSPTARQLHPPHRGAILYTLRRKCSCSRFESS